MKFKKIAALGLIIACCCFSGCSNKTIEKTGNIGRQMGDYVIVKETSYSDPYLNHVIEYLVYNKNTKLMYIYTRSLYGISICPYYEVNDEGIPVVKIYNERIEE